MKNIQSKMLALATLAGSIAVTTSQAQVQLVLTGSTAFRSVDEDRAAAIFDSGAVVTKDSGANNYRTYSGTITSLFGSQTVTIYMGFTGSGIGMENVRDGTQIPVYPSGGTGPTLSLAPDCAFSDSYPEGDNIPSSTFDGVSILGVIPFVFAADNSAQLGGIANLTHEQAILLMTDSGASPAYYFGGTNSSINDKVYLTGRSADSGTRITTFDDIGFTGTPNQWLAPGVPDGTGQSSGSGVRSILATNVSFIGYLGVSDYNAITPASAVHTLSYNGVPFSITNVETGAYPIWGYEHFVSRFGLTAAQKSLRQALLNAIENPGYQSTNVVYNVPFAPLSGMQVQRQSDGGPITSINF